MSWHSGITENSWAVFAGGAELVLLLLFRRRVQGTTLVAAWWWAVAATAFLTATAAAPWASDPRPAALEAIRFAAGALTFCPAMAVLGAKRPQHRAWQLVVFSLWGILALPALENLALRRGQSLAIDGVRSAFLSCLIVLELLNWLPTRRCLTAVFAAAGQVMLYAGRLPFTGELGNYPTLALAAGCLLAATAIAWLDDLTRARKPRQRFDALWLDFRDDFGTLWGVRVAERVNAAAATGDWPVRLTWRGFRSTGGDSTDHEAALPDDVRQSLETVLDNLLRRFTSAAGLPIRR